jgi:hypothetical protein
VKNSIIISLISLIVSTSCFANEFKRALRQAQKAFFSYESNRNAKKRYERQVMHSLQEKLDKEYIIMVGGLAKIAIDQQINTRQLKGLSVYKDRKTDVRADFFWIFNNERNAGVTLNLRREF